MSPEELRELGQQLGAGWVTVLARLLHYNRRTVRGWLAGDSRINPIIADRIRELICEHRVKDGQTWPETGRDSFGRSISAIFFLKVKKAPDDGCWIWLASSGSNGYGMVTICKEKLSAHRASWMIAHKRRIPKGLVVRHKCDVPLCVNPDHLELGTHDDNMADMTRRGRQARGERLHASKLKPEKVIAIRELHSKGVSQPTLAKQFGVKQAVIWNIVHGRIWKHVGGPLAPYDEDRPETLQAALQYETKGPKTWVEGGVQPPVLVVPMNRLAR